MDIIKLLILKLFVLLFTVQYRAGICLKILIKEKKFFLGVRSRTKNRVKLYKQTERDRKQTNRPLK